MIRRGTSVPPLGVLFGVDTPEPAEPGSPPRRPMVRPRQSCDGVAGAVTVTVPLCESVGGAGRVTRSRQAGALVSLRRPVLTSPPLRVISPPRLMTPPPP